MKNSLPVYVISLGCPKNRADTERFLGSLGQDITLTPHPGRAKLIFINTCAFIEPAVRESLRSIIEIIEKLASLKRKPLLAVAGCLPGRYGLAELRKEFPQVDLWLLPENQPAWPALLAKRLTVVNHAQPGRFILPNSSYAWLKIAEGCSHKCAFCAIPAIRGKLGSITPENIIEEARDILRKGVPEIDLVAQDVLGWGSDLPEKPEHELTDLLTKLAGLPGLRWLRLLYLYPGSITREFLERFAEIGAPLLPYLDIPFQHCEREILRRMGRPFTVEPREIIALVREILPESALRATFIVGYPGETEEQFQNLCAFIESVRFHSLGVFTYHAEEGTPAAKFPNQIPEPVKEERRNRLMEIQARISAEILSGYVGRQMDVLVDCEKSEEWPGLFAGRVWFQAPEVDGVTYVSGKGVAPARMLSCEIVDSQTYDLSAMV